MKLTITVLVLALLAAGCGSRDEPKHAFGDVGIRKEMVGTWCFEVGRSKGRMTIGPDGHYIGRIEVTGSNAVRSVEMEGTQEVKGDTLIDTVTKDTQTNAPVPRTSRGRIIRVTEDEMVLRWEGMDSDSVLRKERP